MVTPVLMLMLLTMPEWTARLLRRAGRRVDLVAPAAWGAGLLFVFTASGHFLQTAGMADMLPPWVPHRVALVHATGVLELVIAAAFFTARWRRGAAWAALLVLITFFPVNIYAALHHAPMGGHAWGPVYLLVRGPLQLFILWWIWSRILSVRANARRSAAQSCWTA